MKVALFCGEGDTTSAVANRLIKDVGPVFIVREQGESRSVFLRRRLRRLGLVEVAGQVAFMLLINPVLRRLGAGRREEIARDFGLDLTPPAANLEVASINGDDVLEWLRRERPDVVVVNGTRIISKRILEATDAVFINTHCGIIRVVERERDQADVTSEVETRAAETQVQIRTVTQTIIKEVPIYVPAEADTRFALPVGLVRVHDAAATGHPLPEPSGEPDDATGNLEPSDIAPSWLAATIAENYGVCRLDQARLGDLQDWVRRQQAVTNAP